MKRFLSLLASLLVCTAVHAQSAQISLDFDQLEEKASDVRKVSISRDLIQLALFAIPKGPDTDKARKLISSLQGIYIRSYSFDSAGDYSASDLAPVRKLITGTGWDCVVSVHSKKSAEDTDLCLRKDKDKILGMAILHAEPKELTIVNILGAITPEEFADIQKFLKLNIEIEKPDKPKMKDKDKEKPKDD